MSRFNKPRRNRNTMVLLGPTRSGKTHFLGLLGIHLRYLEAEGEPITFHQKIQSLSGTKTSIELEDIMETLRRGEPIRPTAMSKFLPNDSLIINYDKLFGKKKLELPLCDLAGELFKPIMNNFYMIDEDGDLDIEIVDEQFSNLLTSEDINSDDLTNMHSSIFSAKTYIFMVNIIHCLQFIKEVEVVSKINGIDNRLLGSDEADKLSSRYTSLLRGLLLYREYNRIKMPNNIAVLFTHCSYVDEWLKENSLSLKNEEDRQKVLMYFFSELSGTIKSKIGIKPKVFCSYTKQGKENTWIHKSGLRMPEYPLKEYNRIYDWLKNIYW